MKKQWVIRSKNDNFSYLVNKEWVLTLSLLVLSFLVLFVLSLSVGSTWISPLAVLQQLLGQTNEYSFVIETLRLPRVLLAALVGTALGMAGLILQGIVRNPLASPDIIGITSGASLGANIFIIFLMGSISISYLPFAAIIGAGITSTIIYLLSWNKGVTPIRLVLIGIGMAAIMKACVTFMLVFGNTATTTKAYIWLTGSLYGANLGDVYAMTLWIFIPLPFLLLIGRTMNVTDLGDDTAISLGIRVQLQRVLFLFFSVVFAGSAVAFAGGIEFVGLIAPHLSRMLVGRSFIALIPVTALIGSLLVMTADLIARTLFLPLDIPVGVFTAGIGAPFFLYLLYKNRNL